MAPAIVSDSNGHIPLDDENRWTGGQRESMAKLDEIDLNTNHFTQDLTHGFEPVSIFVFLVI